MPIRRGDFCPEADSRVAQIDRIAGSNAGDTLEVIGEAQFQTELIAAVRTAVSVNDVLFEHRVAL